MVLFTVETIPNQNYQPIGMVSGGMVQSKHMGSDIMASFKNMVGGELTAYTEMMQQARTVATDRMIQQAQSMGADAVIGVRYASSAIVQGAAEVLAYGTAVRFI